jgi:hypothetical protein
MRYAWCFTYLTLVCLGSGSQALAELIITPPTASRRVGCWQPTTIDAMVNRKQEGLLRHIQMTISQNSNQIFQAVFDCVDLGDLPDTVSEGILAFQRATPKLTKHAVLDPLSIDLREV